MWVTTIYTLEIGFKREVLEGPQDRRGEARVMLPGVWTNVKIGVRGERARLYVHDQEQPTLVVNDVKSGASGRGAVALWLDRGTAHFRNITVQP